MNIEQWVRKKKRVALIAPSFVFASGVRLRHWLYDCSILSQKQVSVPVVSIGNLVAGGSGKTQLALKLAGELGEELNVAILSRGYRSLAEKREEPLLVDPTTQRPEECGDEPWMLASRLPDAKVIVGRDRFEGAKLAERSGAKVIILDDGMQHRRLRRDFEIVMIECSDPFGGGSFLPRGLLRDDPKRLAGADLIVFVGEPTEDLKARVAGLSQAPTVGARVVPKVTSLKGVSVGLFCGIGHPERFVNTVRSLGANIVMTLFLPDHQKMGEEVLEEFAVLAKKRGADRLLCTEKDRVKLSGKKVDLPVESVDVKLEMVRNQEIWEKMITAIKRKSL